MKKIALSFISIVFVFAFAKAQTAFHNFGNVQIHDEGQIGFHIDVINDGDFDNNLGLAGFYNVANSLTISGTNEPIFFDMEVDVSNDLFFEVSTGVDNFFDFINGRIITPRDNIGVTLDFRNNGIYSGEGDNTHVDGYVNNAGDLDFRFPIGDDFRLRTMTVLPLDNTFTLYKAAYFFENPNSPSTLTGFFNTDSFQNTLSIISEKEYWDLDGTLPARVTLTWDEQSDIPILADELSSLRVVGFSTTLNQWINLGNSSFSGTMNSGEITSDVIEPNLYSVLTFGSVLKGNGAITVYTLISPNGDGKNDTLIIEGLETSPDNELILFNRWGVEVFRKKNYDNSFNGISNGRATIDGSAELPVGTYFYVLKLQDQKDLAGAFYINR
ncbi:gliding motility-associated C-terminal domain-containing protein [Dokdonia sp.]|uniref:gliding motility-associated C-terminal domain-containing protein n=1 Tax=Dokdonia sp. TaxID=2024995 RepID=UPI0032645B0D